MTFLLNTDHFVEHKDMPQTVRAVAMMDLMAQKDGTDNTDMLNWLIRQIDNTLENGNTFWVLETIQILTQTPNPKIAQILLKKIKEEREENKGLEGIKSNKPFQEFLAREAYNQSRNAHRWTHKVLCEKEHLDRLHRMIEVTESVPQFLQTCTNELSNKNSPFSLHLHSQNWLCQTLEQDQDGTLGKNIKIRFSNFLADFVGNDWETRNHFELRSRLVYGMLRVFVQKDIDEDNEAHLNSFSHNLTSKTALAIKALSGMTGKKLVDFVKHNIEHANQYTNAPTGIEAFASMHGVMTLQKSVKNLTERERALVVGGMLLHNHTRKCVRLHASDSFDIKRIKTFLKTLGTPKAFTLTPR